MFESPFPSDVGFCFLDASKDPAPQLLSEELALLSPRAAKRRQQQFVYGRGAAHQALKALGIVSEQAIGMAKSGEPLWPKGIIGSITHCDTFAAAAVCSAENFVTIGIDLERYTRVNKLDISKKIASPNEQNWLESIPELKLERTVLLFSAKETIFKALFPLCQRYIGYQDVELTVTEGGILAKLKTELSDSLPINHLFPLGYMLSGEYVLTYLVSSDKQIS